jgi:hypothetical protein
MTAHDPRVIHLPVRLRDLITACGPPPPHALPQGTRIIKVKTEQGDVRPVGALGTAWGVVHHKQLKPLCYIVQWDDAPDLPTAVIDWKIARAQ